MAYPDVPQCVGTRLEPRKVKRNREASNGTVRTRALASGAIFDPIIVHSLITYAQYQTLKDFYRDNIASTFTVAFLPALDNLSLTCVFADENAFNASAVPSGLYNVTVRLQQAS